MKVFNKLNSSFSILKRDIRTGVIRQISTVKGIMNYYNNTYLKQNKFLTYNDNFNTFYCTQKCSYSSKTKEYITENYENINKETNPLDSTRQRQRRKRL